MSWKVVICGLWLCSFAAAAEVPDAVSGATPSYDPANGVPVLSFSGLKRLLVKYPDLVFVDARFGEHFNGHRLPGALLLNSKSPADEVRIRLPDLNQVIVVYCSNPDCPAGFWMAERLAEMGYSRVYEFPGGIDEWMSRGERTVDGPAGAGKSCSDRCAISFAGAIPFPLTAGSL